MTKTKQNAYSFGIWAEYFAMIILFFKGYRTLERRYKTKTGEIDLIVKRKELLVFVEVKARQSLSTALEAVTDRAKRRIEKTALSYIQRNPQYSGYALRFDLFACESSLKWAHLDNAWESTT